MPGNSDGRDRRGDPKAPQLTRQKGAVGLPADPAHSGSLHCIQVDSSGSGWANLTGVVVLYVNGNVSGSKDKATYCQHE